MPKIKLTHKNYFTKQNKYLSNSKIGDYLRDPYFFYRKHIVHKVDYMVTDPMIIGSAVDCILTESLYLFKKRYMTVSRRTKDETYEYQLTESMYNTVMNIAEAVKRTTAYKDLKKAKYKRQVLLKHDMPLGSFKGMCGMLDFLKIDGDAAHIVDLKTAVDASPHKYAYKCEDFGYFRQMAMYSMLVMYNYPEVKHVSCSHLVVEKDPDEIYNCRTFFFDDIRIQSEIFKLGELIKEISEVKEWKRSDISWSDAEILT